MVTSKWFIFEVHYFYVRTHAHALKHTKKRKKKKKTKKKNKTDRVRKKTETELTACVLKKRSETHKTCCPVLSNSKAFSLISGVTGLNVDTASWAGWEVDGGSLTKFSNRSSLSVAAGLSALSGFIYAACFSFSPVSHQWHGQKTGGTKKKMEYLAVWTSHWPVHELTHLPTRAHVPSRNACNWRDQKNGLYLYKK